LLQVSAGEERKEGGSRFRPTCFSGSVHAPPMALARGKTCRHCSSTVAAIPEVVPLQFPEFWGLFCKFWIM